MWKIRRHKKKCTQIRDTTNGIPWKWILSTIFFSDILVGWFKHQLVMVYIVTSDVSIGIKIERLGLDASGLHQVAAPSKAKSE